MDQKVVSGVKPSLGVVGQGSFGQFIVDKMADIFDIHTYSRDDSEAVFADVAKCDYLALAVPLSVYPEVLDRLVGQIGDTTVLVDVCSVKERPLELIYQKLPNRSLLATHPLFGPESAKDSLSGHTLIICPSNQTPDSLIQESSKFFARLGLKVIQMSAEEHDRLMADLQGLTFFIAQALVEYGVGGQEVITPSFQRLLDLADLEKHHSSDLLATIESGNRFAVEKRRKLLDILDDIHSRLQN